MWSAVSTHHSLRTLWSQQGWEREGQKTLPSDRAGLLWKARGGMAGVWYMPATRQLREVQAKGSSQDQHGWKLQLLQLDGTTSNPTVRTALTSTNVPSTRKT